MGVNLERQVREEFFAGFREEIENLGECLSL